MDVNELYRYTARLERDGYKSTPYRVNLYSRFSLALTPLILVMLGLGLALRHEQIHLTSMVAVGLGLMFVYWLFFGFCVSFGQAGSIPVLLARSSPPSGLRCGGGKAAASGGQMTGSVPDRGSPRLNFCRGDINNRLIFFWRHCGRK